MKEEKFMIRKCDCCGRNYEADSRNVKRGWGLCCSKSCAAKKREKSKRGYNPFRVAENNYRREHWNDELMEWLDEQDALDAMGEDYLSECGDKD